MKQKLQGTKHRMCAVAFARVYPYYVAKAVKKGRTTEELNKIIRWLTGYTQRGLDSQLKKQTDFEHFFGDAPKLNPLRKNITGVICGVRIEEIQDPFLKEIRYLDKLIDELAQGKEMVKILRNRALDAKVNIKPKMAQGRKKVSSK